MVLDLLYNQKKTINYNIIYGEHQQLLIFISIKINGVESFVPLLLSLIKKGSFEIELYQHQEKGNSWIPCLSLSLSWLQNFVEFLSDFLSMKNINNNVKINYFLSILSIKENRK